MKTRFLLSIAVVIMLASCDSVSVSITDITFEREAVALRIGETTTLSVSVYPIDTSMRNLRWTSSDNSIATINERGEVTALAAGTVEITVATNDGSQIAKCLVVVVGEPNIVMDIALHQDVELSAFIGFNLPGITVIDWGDGTELEVTVNVLRSGRQEIKFSRNLAKTASRSNIGSHRVKVYSDHIVGFRAFGHQLTYQFTNLDISGATNLEALDLRGHQFTSLDLSKNTKLDYILIWGTQLTSLDVSNNAKLKTLYLIVNPQLTSLNLGNNNAMRFLYASESPLTSLDVRGLSNLIGLSVGFNRLTSLDVSGLYHLRSLNVPDNQFDAQAFNELFRSLNNTPVSKFIGVAGNPGSDGFDSSIAENKGWTIRASVGFGGLR